MATLSAGTRLGPYEVVGLIGAGGMGEVYRARDTRLDRTVAVKVLPSDLAGDPERRSRLEREVRTISGVNHPNICTLHDVGEADGRAFLVMEHLVGETLAERLKKGPLPLEQALTVATEIADALAAAHRQGVVHRDLKPGNVMLTKSGAKLLDFGLAKGDVVLVSGDRQATLQSLIETRATELWPELSPDGRWLAYGSDASGRFDVYVRSSSRGGTAEPVSVEGGWSPAWHPNGRELFFVTPPDAAGKRRIVAAGFSPGSPPSIGRPHPLFEYARRDLAFSCHPVRCHDVAPDGQRFYAVQIPAPTAVPVVTHIDLVQNWVEELKAKVPSR